MNARVVLLMNFVAPYRVPLFQAIRRRLDDFKILISTPMEPDRPWRPDWADLEVAVQNTVTVPIRHRQAGFSQQLFVHFPYDTLPRLHRLNPDVVISGELGMRSLQAALYRLVRRDSRLLIWATLSEATEQGWGSVRTAVRRLILRCADGVVVNGASGARYISSLGVAVPIFIMNQPVDIDRFCGQPLDVPPQAARRLIYSGRLIGQKGVVEFQRAVAGWASRRPDAKIDLVWLGDGELRPILESAALPENMTQSFKGYVAYEDLPAIYASCGVLALPSFFDEWGLVVNEAMASGLPVLGSIHSQAVEEMVTDGVTGWRFDPRDPASVAAALDAFSDATDAQLAAMRKAARARAAMITPETAADCMLEAIRTVMRTDARRQVTHPAQAPGE